MIFIVDSDGDIERKFEMSAVTVESEPLFVYLRAVCKIWSTAKPELLFFSCLC